MKSQHWRGVAWGLLVIGTNSQTGPLTSLGSLLGNQENLTTFYALIQKYPDILLQLPSQAGVTILAPNNEAFNKVPFTSLNEVFDRNETDTITAVLQYHILNGTRKAADLVPGIPDFVPTLLTNTSYTNVIGGQRVTSIKQAGDVVVFISGLGSRSTLVQEDLEFNGGVVQVINSLLIPPTNFTTTTTSFNLTSYQGALYASKKIQEVAFTPNITIFAPTNNAFMALGPAISSMTIEQLSSILDYHIVPGQVTYSTSLLNGTQLVTQNGAKITVLHSGNDVYINSAQLITRDILLANGVLHTLDNVLNPQAPDTNPIPQIPTQAPVFASASTVNSIPFTSAIPCTTVSCPVSSSSTERATAGAGGGSSSTSFSTTSTFKSSSSSAQAAARARETGLGAVGWVAVVGGAVMVI